MNEKRVKLYDKQREEEMGVKLKDGKVEEQERAEKVEWVNNKEAEYRKSGDVGNASIMNESTEK